MSIVRVICKCTNIKKKNSEKQKDIKGFGEDVLIYVFILSRELFVFPVVHPVCMRLLFSNKQISVGKHTII